MCSYTPSALSTRLLTITALNSQSDNSNVFPVYEASYNAGFVSSNCGFCHLIYIEKKIL